MKRVKMFMSGVVALALLCSFGAPMVQAQVLDGTTHQIKLSGSFAAVESGMGFSKEGGSEGGAVVLRFTGVNVDTGGFDYDIYVLDDTGLGFICDEVGPIGTLSTYAGETEAIGSLDIADFPEAGLTLVGRFFAQVKTTPGKTQFKSVAGWSEIMDGSPPDPDAISKKTKVKAKEKTLEKLGFQCTL